MTAFLQMTWVDLKLFLRNYISTFFTLAFPVLMLLVFGAMYGNDPSPLFGGFGGMDVTVPGYIAALIIGTAGFMNLPLELASRREQGILRRFRATPLNPLVLLGAQMLVNLLTVVAGTLLLGLVGVIVFDLRLPESIPAVLLGMVFSCISLFSVSFLLASLLRTTAAARAVCMALFYPMMFLSGGTMPRELMPDILQRISDFLPLTYIVNLLKDLWFGRGWNLTALVVLSMMLLIGLLVSLKLFRWE